MYVVLSKKRGLRTKWYLQLKAENHETMMHSENYDSKDNAKRAVRQLSEGLGISIMVKDTDISYSPPR